MPSGLDPIAGVTADDEAEAAVNRVMVHQAKRTIVVVDSSKLGRIGFSRICHLGEVSAVLTDSAAEPRALEALAGGRRRGDGRLRCRRNSVDLTSLPA